MQPIRVAVVGAAGKMGKESVRAIACQPDMQLVAAIDPAAAGKDAGVTAGLPAMNLAISSEAESCFDSAKPDVLVCFSDSTAVPTLRAAIARGISLVVGTTGFSDSDLKEIEALCRDKSVGALIAPNFAIGAVLMMRFACEAAEHMPCAEIIELHHDQKRDAPSGTALRTAELMQAAAGGALRAGPGDQASRGQADGPIRIHSVRLQGLVAHQEVIFGGQGQTLTIRHDSTGRESFMPGMLLAIRKVQALKGLVVGLENIL